MEDGGVLYNRNENDGEIEIPIISRTTHDDFITQESCNQFCSFTKQENNEMEREHRAKSLRKLSGLMIFYLVIMTVEVVGGLKANSLAVLADAAHMLTDVVGVSISLFAVWASGWKATANYSFGFNRLEVLGALLSLQLIWLISGLLIYEAVSRLLHEREGVNGKLMFLVATFGFMVNFIMVSWLGHDHHTHHHGCAHDDHQRHHHSDEELCVLATSDGDGSKSVPDSAIKSKILNINLQGAYLHIMADLIQSVGVMIAGAIIWVAPHWLVVDLISTLVFSVLVLSTTLSLLRNIFSILMERTPSEIDVDILWDDVKRIKGVRDVCDLHVWAVTLGKIVMSCHVVAEPEVSPGEVVRNVRDYCHRRYKIHHVTIQVE